MFSYLMPTKVIVGENCVKENCKELILGTKAMIVTGKSSGLKSGALGDVTAVLEDNKIPYIVYDEVENNPTIENTADGGSKAREFGADFLIGIGGGSPLDAAKAIAVYAVNEPIEGSDFELMDIYKGVFKNKPLPMAAIPTTAGTGSEVTPYSILTIHAEKSKRNFTSTEVFYKTAFIDGRYTKNLPLQVARNTAADAMCHLVEGFTNKRSSPATDYIALEGLRVIGKHLEKLEKGGLLESECTELLWASTLAGMVIAQTGTTVVHSMGYPLTYYKDIPHGMANGLLLGEYMEYTNKVLPEKIDACLRALNVDFSEFKAYLKRILPCDKDVSEQEITEWTKTTIKAKNVLICPFEITREMEINIFKKCFIYEKNS